MRLRHASSADGNCSPARLPRQVCAPTPGADDHRSESPDLDVDRSGLLSDSILIANQARYFHGHSALSREFSPLKLHGFESRGESSVGRATDSRRTAQAPKPRFRIHGVDPQTTSPRRNRGLTPPYDGPPPRVARYRLDRRGYGATGQTGATYFSAPAAESLRPRRLRIWPAASDSSSGPFAEPLRQRRQIGKCYRPPGKRSRQNARRLDRGHLVDPDTRGAMQKIKSTGGYEAGRTAVRR